VAQVAVCSQINTYKTHKYSVDRAYNCWMLNWLVHHVTNRVLKVKLCTILLATVVVSHLYSGIPEESLNQSTMLILSFGEGGETSQGSSASVPLTAQTTWAGTATECTSTAVVFTRLHLVFSGRQRYWLKLADCNVVNFLTLQCNSVCVFINLFPK